ncbi:MAG: PAS domain S-box protein [Anaerolineales bacterium]
MTPQQPLHVLLIEDSFSYAELIIEYLTGVRHNAYTVHHADNLTAAVQDIPNLTVDIVLLDLGLPDSGGLDTLQHVLSALPHTPIIVLTADDDEKQGLNAIAGGAQDYLFKGDITPRLLQRALRYALERHQADQRRRKLESEQHKLSRVVEQSLSAVIIYDLSGWVEYVNPRFTAMTGYSLADARAQRRTTPNEHPHIRQTVRAGGEWHGEFRRTRADGEPYWERVSVSPIRDAKGQLTHILEVREDISKQKDAVNALAESEEKFRLLTESSPTGIFIMQDEIIRYANPAFARLVARAPEDIPDNLHLADIISADALPDLRAGLQRLQQRAQDSLRATLRIQNGEPTPQPVELLAQRIDYGHRNAIIGSLQDTSSEATMRQAEREQRLWAESLRDALMLLTSTLDADEVLERMLSSLERVVPHDAANIMRLEGDLAYVTAHRGYPLNAENRVFRAADLPPLHDEAPQSIGDLTQESAWPVLSTPAARAILSVPIRLDNTIVGLLNVISHTAHCFEDHHLERLGVFAGGAAIALNNADIYHQLNRYADEISLLNRASSFLFTTLSDAQDVAEISAQVVAAVANAFPGVECAVLLPQAGNLGPRPSAQTPGYLPRRAANRNETPAGVAAQLLLPLHTGQRTLGLLDLQSTAADAFDERDERILGAVATRAATAIENMQLYDQTQHQADELAARVRERTAELENARDHVEAILNSSSDAIALTNLDGFIHQANPAFSTLFGYYDEGTYFQQTLTLLMASDSIPDLLHAHRTLLSDETPQRIEVTAQRRDKSTFSAELALALLPTTSYHAVGIVCTFHDITAHKAMQAQLRTALEKERELGNLKTRFIAMASHEFRTPLAAIQSSSNIVRDYRAQMSDTEIDDTLTDIDEQVAHMNRLLEDVLTIGHAQAQKVDFQPEPLALRPFTHKIIQDVRRQHGSEYSIVFSATNEAEQPVMADSRLLRHILTNLLSNAIKYSPENPEVYLKLRFTAEEVIYEVIDYGIGIPAADRERLYETFFRAENVGAVSGTGLGLAIAKHAIDLHGGRMSFDSIEGQGTTFRVYLPRSDYSDATSEQAP